LSPSQIQPLPSFQNEYGYIEVNVTASPNATIGVILYWQDFPFSQNFPLPRDFSLYRNTTMSLLNIGGTTRTYDSPVLVNFPVPSFIGGMAVVTRWRTKIKP
jgi:hypothetical protein